MSEPQLAAPGVPITLSASARNFSTGAGLALPMEDIMDETSKPTAPTDDESDPKAKARDLLISLAEKLHEADWPIELLSLSRQLLDANWPNDKIREIIEAKITELESARTTQKTPPAPDQG
jgi:hypothetical protein